MIPLHYRCLCLKSELKNCTDDDQKISFPLRTNIDRNNRTNNKNMSKHQLICMSVIELDTNGEVMETYRYPAIPTDVNQVILSRNPLFNKSLLNDEREQQQQKL